MIKNVLLDLDDTLLDFHRAEAEAIRHTLKEFGIDPTDETIRLYSKINRSCWEKLENIPARRFCTADLTFYLTRLALPVTLMQHKSSMNTDSVSVLTTLMELRSFFVSCTENTDSTLLQTAL